MNITNSLVLATDTEIFPVDRLTDIMRVQIQAVEGDYAITRPYSRTTARVVDGDSARLIEQFRQPATVVQAVIRYCNATKDDPESTLESAFPMLEGLVHARLLLPQDAAGTGRLIPLFEAGEKFAGTRVIRCLQALEDSEVYQVEIAGGQSAALKIMRSGAGPEIARIFDREEFVLRYLQSSPAPALLTSGSENDLRYLMLSWCDGDDCATAAAVLRSSSNRSALLDLASAILNAYGQLHAQGVVHSDVHPRNILVGDDNRVWIIDFGMSRVDGVESSFQHAERGGVAFFFEPEYANSLRTQTAPPPSSALGEQYALAALIHLLLTGKHYLDFSLEKNEMLRQIAEDESLSFGSRGLEPWPEIEAALAKALAKDPVARFPTLAAFEQALRTAGECSAILKTLDTGPFSLRFSRDTLTRILDQLDAGASLFSSGIPTAPKASLTYGSAGVACALHHIACARQDAMILSLADLWGERAVRDSVRENAWHNPEIQITTESVGRISPYHTRSGVGFVKTLIAHAMGDGRTRKIALDSFLADIASAPCENLDLTLGLSGVLLAAAQLFAALGTAADLTALRAAGDATLDSIWQQLDSYTSISDCRQIRYTGIAHGWAGMLYATLCWCRASGRELPVNTVERLDQLAGLARHSGRHARWSWSVGRESAGSAAQFMAGWCNGTAGQVWLWLSAHATLHDERFLVLAEKAAWHTYEAGGAIPSLCCGVPGQAYALLAVYRHSGEKAWLHRAQALAERIATACIDTPKDAGGELPYSLFKGELGVAVLAADLESPEESAFPAFEPIESLSNSLH
jgi:serine/threonine protein kinase